MGLVVFPSMKYKINRPMTKEGVAYIFKVCLDKADIEKSAFRRYSTHSMRKTFVNHLLDTKGIPLQDVQDLMGHKNPNTTERYRKRKKSHEESPIFRIAY